MRITSQRADPLSNARLFRDPTALTPRERDALRAFAKHGNYQAAADALGVKLRSLHERFGVIRQKLGVATNELAIKAVGMGG